MRGVHLNHFPRQGLDTSRAFARRQDSTHVGGGITILVGVGDWNNDGGGRRVVLREGCDVVPFGPAGEGDVGRRGGDRHVGLLPIEEDDGGWWRGGRKQMMNVYGRS